MKALKQLLVFALVTFLAVNTSFAKGNERDDNEINQLRASVENASATDWKVYAEAAERCIELKANLSEAYIWIEKSIEINSNSENLEVKGDYLKLNGAKKMAIATYNQAILAGMNEGRDITKLQKKVLRLR
ncbi:hypothetical protein KMW28_03175 [Flammeovirga yaeyamensis]|uniref:DUF4363 family protein n=1 Tax=Flammeovirga yaeyamensis TaxID=367791 RepID=A0AAX1N836_9BACT|nr:hypothetical protein [Flammeovirga yaeyamensis]MBB3700520.1 hypothetical protein [Flammeovirga yaeyamensis]NMF36859.1 hypothetical protein [Flammeovirga yaeyamensis]QWG02591.1 hypothetical protein KMW28_03175 [Flammeovirga yaeyamensis]